MQLTNGLTPRLEHTEASSSNAGLIKKKKRKKKKERKGKNSTVSSCTCSPQGYATNPARIDMCGGRRRGRAARVPPRNKHRMHERGARQHRQSVAVVARGIGGLGQRQQGVRKRGMDGWASCELSGAGRLVRLYYPPRERVRGVDAGEGARRKRGSSGLVLPASTGGGGGMG